MTNAVKTETIHILCRPTRWPITNNSGVQNYYGSFIILKLMYHVKLSTAIH